ncbi:MAG: hypothetical protein ACRC35_01370 [Angustibacter sp.]
MIDLVDYLNGSVHAPLIQAGLQATIVAAEQAAHLADEIDQLHEDWGRRLAAPSGRSRRSGESQTLDVGAAGSGVTVHVSRCDYPRGRGTGRRW